MTVAIECGLLMPL